ncbi:MAG: hypothetical protein DCO96_05055 [Fluviicola sp. XM-24bin1]|nr:MAG: hypothetical protein DCO96_05055 [Fluviicola sp. XM-24bin1]
MPYSSSLFFLLFGLSLLAQEPTDTADVTTETDYTLRVYISSQEYSNGQEEILGVYARSFTNIISSPYTLRYLVGDSLAEIGLKKYWGFSIGSNHFRLIGGHPYHIYHEGKLIYYESGEGLLRNLSRLDFLCY